MNGAPANFVRRARPALGTIVEIGAASTQGADASIDTTFAEVAALQGELSRFDPCSDVARFNTLPAGASLELRSAARDVLAAADRLRCESGGLFDISAGTSPRGWSLTDDGRAVRHDTNVRIDLGGIAKGHVVDRAVQCLQAHGVRAGWVNAGGDLRVFGETELPLWLRDERNGGTRAFGRLADGAFATSCYAPGARSRLAGSGVPPRRVADALSSKGPRSLARVPAAHVSVAAPLCLWADALTKIVALTGNPAHPLLARHGAQAWCH